MWFLLYDETLRTSALYFHSRAGEAYCPQGHHLFYIRCENYCMCVRVCVFLCVCECVHSLFQTAVSIDFNLSNLAPNPTLPTVCCHILVCVCVCVCCGGHAVSTLMFPWAAEHVCMSWQLLYPYSSSTDVSKCCKKRTKVLNVEVDVPWKIKHLLVSFGNPCETVWYTR